jgi:sec-independent protein translocase protein TatB
MSFSETIFLFFLALIVFGPKKLPEIARQAGKLLAELRRASNEFKSQIETEIAHLEVEKTKQTISAPTGPPQGAVASLSLNPASPTEAATPLSSATLAATAESAALPDPAALLPTEAITRQLTAAADEPASRPTPQDSHV